MGNFFKKALGTLGGLAQAAGPIVSAFGGPQTGAILSAGGSLLGGLGGGPNYSSAINSGLGMPSGYPQGAIDNFVQIQRNIADAEFANQNRAYANAAANRAYSAQVAAANRAASMQTEKNRQRQLKKVYRQLSEQRDRVMGYYEPYKQAGEAVLPLHTEAYTQGINTANLLRGYLTAAPAMEALNAARPAFQIAVPKFEL